MSKSAEEYAKGLLKLDNIVAKEANGAYTLPFDESAPMHDIRALDRYCKQKGIKMSELTDEELKKFEVAKQKKSAG